MLTPTYSPGDNKCILIIALNPKNALVKYKKIQEILSDASYQILDTFNPCIIAHVDAERFFASTSKIESLLEKGDIISTVSCSEKGPGYRVLMKRLDNDSEIRSIMGTLWDIPWMR